MPWDFWRLTLRELILQTRGFRWREEQERWRMASIIAAIRNPLRTVQVDPKKIKKSDLVTAKNVLEGKQKSTHKTSDPYAHKRMLESLVRRTAKWKPREPERKPQQH